MRWSLCHFSIVHGFHADHEQSDEAGASDGWDLLGTRLANNNNIHFDLQVGIFLI